MKIKMLTTVPTKEKVFYQKKVYDVSDARAKSLIDARAAVKFEAPKPKDDGEKKGKKTDKKTDGKK